MKNLEDIPQLKAKLIAKRVKGLPYNDREVNQCASDISWVIHEIHAQGRIVPDGFVAVPLEPTGPMIMYGIHAHEKNDDLPNIGLGPKCVSIYKRMIMGLK